MHVMDPMQRFVENTTLVTDPQLKYVLAFLNLLSYAASVCSQSKILIENGNRHKQLQI